MTIQEYAEIAADAILCAIFGVLLLSIAWSVIVNAVHRRRWYRKDWL